MIFKIISACFICVIICNPISSQKVDTDRKILSVKITQFPENNSLRDFNTFTAKISAYKQLWYNRKLNKNELENKLIMHGFQRFKEKGDFVMDVIIDKHQVIENTIINMPITDYKGKKTDNYVHKYSFYIPITVRLLDKKGALIYSEVMTTQKDLKSWTSKGSEDLQQVKDDAKNKFWSTFNELVVDYLNNVLPEIASRLNNTFGYYYYGAWAQRYILDSKKHPEYQAYTAATDTMKHLLKTVEPGGNVAEYQRIAAGPIQYFENLVPKLSVADKEQNKLLEATYINLMDLYFFSDNFLKFRENANKLLAMNAKGDNEKYKVQDLERILKKMEAANCKSIYYVRPETGESYVNNESAPNGQEINAADSLNNSSNNFSITDSTSAAGATTPENNYDYNSLKVHPADLVFPGSYTDKENKLTKGYFVIEDVQNMRFYGTSQNAKFYSIENEKPKKLDTNPNNFSQLEFNGKIFKTQLYKDAEDVFSKAQIEPMEVILSNSKIEMYFPRNNKFRTQKNPAPWVFSVKGKDKVIVISPSELIWKKKLKEVFAGCEPVETEISNTGFLNLSQSKIIEWCKKFEDCSK